MGLRALLKSKLLLRGKSTEADTVKALRKEIRILKEENKALKEKIIVFPKRKNEKICIRFFDKNIEDKIIKNIRETKKEIYIAMAWFTSKKIIDELNNLKGKGIHVKVIISGANVNLKKENFDRLMEACNELKVIVIPKTGSGKYSNLMHNKYCIIDKRKVIDGSYNWSNNAKYNLEHIVVIKSKSVAKMYRKSFNKIYNNPKYYIDYNVYERLG